MIKQLKYKNVTWLDLSKPSKEEIYKLAEQYNLHDLVVEELLKPTSRSKVDLYEECIYLTLQFPISRKEVAEIDFVLGKDFIITSHHESVQALSEFSQILEGGNDSKKEKGFHAGHLFYYMIRELYEPIETELDSVANHLKQIEEKIFAGQEAKMVRSLSQLNHRLLDIKWSLKFHRNTLNSLIGVGKEFYGNNFGYYLNAIISEYEHVSELVDSNREIFNELHSTNESLLLIKNSHATRVLTALAFIFLPVSLISFIFSMTGSEAVVGTFISWYGILILMMLAALLTFGIAKYKKWI